ncbi:MAG: OmpP1/FadL family transporter [Steroidobacteraceae bacterium]
MQTRKKLQIAIATALSGAALLGTHHVCAAGFALMEQNSSGLGNAYAGAAAVAEDASTIYFNAAGLTQLKRPSLVLNVAGIDVQSEFKNSASAQALGQGLGGDGGDAGGLTVLPSFYLAVPLTDKVSGGVGVNAPFGLKTEYNDDWMGRFQAIKSDVKTTNINTALAFKIHDKVSLGIGADFQSIDATLTSAVNYTAIIASNTAGALILPGLQGTSLVKGNDSAWGYDLGVLFTPNDSTRVGLSYRSAIKYHLAGNASFTTPTTANATGQAIINAAHNSTTNAAAPTDGAIALNLKLPASARLAAVQKLGGAFELLGEVSWTQWSSVPELKIVRTNGAVGVLKNTPEKWDDTMRYAVGANWQVNKAVKLRVGAALDESPVPDSTRTPRLPDNDRTWLSAGARLDVNKRLTMDMGYTHIMVKDAQLNQNDGSTNAYGLLLGKQKTSIDILGVQATASF